MDDLTGLGKVAESVAKIGDTQLVNKAYDDLLADAMRVGGQMLVDTIKAFRLFTAPIQLLAVAQDRLAAFCDQVRAKVPEDRQQEAAPSIALPVLMDLRFMEDDNPLTELYLNLLARAIDKERCNEVHPAFVKIIEQMSSDEAKVMYWLGRGTKVWFLRQYLDDAEASTFSDTNIPRDHSTFWHNSLAYLFHLRTLCLACDYDGYNEAEGTHYQTFVLTSFGRLFVQACIPEDFDLAKLGGHSAAASSRRD